MSTTTKRPLPQMHHADDNEVLVFCSECEWGPEAQSTAQKAFDAFDLHVSRDHTAWGITEPWQAAEVLGDRINGWNDAEGIHVWEWVTAHVGSVKHGSPQQYLMLVADACSTLADYANEYAEQALRLRAEMPFDASMAEV